jgi:hypothetical protein
MTSDFLFGGSYQFHQPRIDPVSPSIVPLELIYDEKLLAHGTGFVWVHKDEYFLITNWHNFTGQHPFSGAHLSDGAAIPNKVRAHIASEATAQPGSLIRSPILISLYEHFDQPYWLQHQRFQDLRIDIVALRLPSNPDAKYLAINRFDEQPKLFSHVGSEVFIVGYPFSDFDHVALKFPIWKRGSIASEVFFGWQGRPAFLIDAASRRGMSGSPVFRRIFGPAPVPHEGNFEIKVDNIMTQEFIGVYSGHLFNKSEDVTIGIAWYGNLVHEILNSPAPAMRL